MFFLLLYYMALVLSYGNIVFRGLGEKRIS